MAWGNGYWWLNFGFLGNVRVEDWKERDQHYYGMSASDTRTLQSVMWRSVYDSRYGRYNPNQCSQDTNWLYKPIWECYTPDLPHPLVSFILCPSSSCISLSCPQLHYQLRTHRWIIPHKLCMSWLWVNTECSIDCIQHPPGTVCTAYSIHQIQHPPKSEYLPNILTIPSRTPDLVSISGISATELSVNIRHDESSKKGDTYHVPTIVRLLTNEVSLNT